MRKLSKILAALTVQLATHNSLKCYEYGIISGQELNENARYWIEWEDKVNA